MPPKAKAKAAEPKAKTKTEPKVKSEPKAKAEPPLQAIGALVPPAYVEKIASRLQEYVENKKAPRADVRELLEAAKTVKDQIDANALDVLTARLQETEDIEKLLKDQTIQASEASLTRALVDRAGELDIGDRIVEEARERLEAIEKAREEVRLQMREKRELLMATQKREQTEVEEQWLPLKDNLKKDFDKWMDACADADIGKMKKLLEKWPWLLELSDHEGSSGLSECAMAGEIEPLEYLVKEKKACINGLDNLGKSPIYRCSYNKAGVDICLLLIDTRADVLMGTAMEELLRDDGVNAEKATGKEVLDMLLERKKQQGHYIGSLTRDKINSDTFPNLQTLPLPWTSLARVAVTDIKTLNDVSKSNAILQSQPIVKIAAEALKKLHDPSDTSDYPFLPWLELVLELFAADRHMVDMPIDSNNGGSMLWYACAGNGNLEACKVLLLENGADPNYCQVGGISCLMQACVSNRKDICDLLVERKAYLHILSDLRKNCLHFCTVGTVKNDALKAYLIQTHGKDAFAGIGCDLNPEEVSFELQKCGANYGNRAFQEATAGLKNLSLEQIKDKGAQYQELIAQRDAADVLGIT